jgi:hypothetical protein
MEPLVPRLTEKTFLFLNRFVIDLPRAPVRDHPYIRHAIDIGLYEMPEHVVYQDISEEVRRRHNKYLQ